MPVKYKGILKINFGFYMPKYIYIYIKGLLTECEVCTGKYLPEVFRTDRATKERALSEKTESKYFPLQIE